MLKTLRLFRIWRNELRNKRRIADQDKAYLINCYADTSLMRKLIKECNNDPTLVVELHLADGTRVVIRSETDKPCKRPVFNGDE